MTDLPGRPRVFVVCDPGRGEQYAEWLEGYDVTTASALGSGTDIEGEAGVIIIDERGASGGRNVRAAVGNPDWWRVALVSTSPVEPTADGPIDVAVTLPVEPSAFEDTVEGLAGEALAAARRYEQSSLRVRRNVVATEVESAEESDETEQREIDAMTDRLDEVEERLAAVESELEIIEAVVGDDEA